LVIMPPQNGADDPNQPFPTTNPDAVGSDVAAFSGIAVDEDWSQLEPEPGQYDWTPLDASLASVSEFDQAHPTHQLAVKLRVFPGFSAPNWAKSIGGPPLSVITNSKSGRTNTLGRWWSESYEAAWSTFQNALAARYDHDPLIAGVQVTSCSTTTDEPFIVNAVDLPPLEAAGRTTAAYESCLQGALRNYSGWHNTAVYFPINTMPKLDNGPKNGSIFATQIVQQCAASASKSGPRCVIDNHGLGKTSHASFNWLSTAIDHLWQQNPTTTLVAFQADSQTKGEDCAAIVDAISDHAGSVELWQPISGVDGYRGFAANSLADLASWNAALRSGKPPAC